MNIIDRAIIKLGGVLRSEYDALKAKQKLPSWLLQEAGVDEYAIPDPSVYDAQAEFYRVLSWVNGAISIKAETCALGGYEVKRVDGETTESVDNHDFERLLRKPNPYQSQFEFMVDCFSFMSINANTYWFLNRPSADVPPIEIWNIPPSMINPQTGDKLGVEKYLYYPGDGQEIPLEPFEVCHFHGFNPFLRWVGLSKLESIGRVMTTDLAMQKYGKDVYTGNGRIPGILAFAENYTPQEWAEVKRQVDKNAQKAKMMLMYNVKQGGVNWIQTAISAKEMEQLATRKFNREEIYSTLAPGLMSMLSENATEANARTGQRTFIDLACWPMLVMVGQKITQSIMPAYGDSFICDPVDIRITDKQLRLSEIQEYSKTHTIDEIRVEFWDDPELGDLRGDLLPVQITPDVGNGEETEEPEPETIPNTPPVAPVPMTVEEVAEDELDEETMTPDEEAAMAKWQRYAVKRFKEGKPELMTVFTGSIPAGTRRRIETALKTAGSVEAVQSAFTRQHDDRLLWEAIKAIREATRVLNKV